MTNLDIESFIPNTEHNFNIEDYVNTDYINNITKGYENHPSILTIKEYVKVENKFVFKDSTADAFANEINRLDSKNAGIENDIPNKILIGSNNIVASHISMIYNNSKNGCCNTHSEKNETT